MIQYKVYLLQIASIVLLASSYSPKSLIAQSNTAKKEAEKAMKAGDYTKANAYWNYLEQRKKLTGKYAIAKAACEFEVGFYQKSLDRLNRLSKKNQRNSTSLYYFARLYHMREQYKEANIYYRQYLHHADEKDKLRDNAKLYLSQLFNAQNQLPTNSQLISFINEVDSSINTPYDDFGLYRHPIQPNTYLYTSHTPFPQKNNNKTINVPYFLKKIYSTEGTEGFWTKGKMLSRRYNPSSTNSEVLGFIDGGYQVVFKANDSLLVDNFNEESQSLALPFTLPKNGSVQEDFYFFGNNILLFSAISPDGFGKRDLYWSNWNEEDSTWAEPVNFGAQINTPAEERTPFLANDGKTLYFSRNSSECIGGYDIFVSHFNAQTFAWSKPEPLPKPINSVADDLFFYPQSDGMTAFMSSNRWQTKGGLDFFTVLLAEHMAEQATKQELKSFVDILLSPPMYANNNIEEVESIATEAIVAEKPIGHYIYPMFYEQNISTSPSALKNLQTLSSVMNEHKSVKLIINAHAHSLTQSNAYTLFLTIKQAENFANQLIAAGIEGDRILLRSGGNLYPIANPIYYNGEVNPNAQKLNQRILINLINTAELPFQIKEQNITIGPLMKVNGENLFEEKQKGLQFKIQIRKSNALWRHAILEERKDIVIEQWANEPTIIYLCGFYNSFQEAANDLEKLQKAYELEKPLILPYIDNWRLTEENLYLHLENYPDLKNYIDYIENQK